MSGRLWRDRAAEAWRVTRLAAARLARELAVFAMGIAVIAPLQLLALRALRTAALSGLQKGVLIGAGGACLWFAVAHLTHAFRTGDEKR